ncbi:ABC transporter ATP-binding protein [Anaerolineae bacterium CFX9]|nr:ABC transporter ATP-binding protein [Anaerolineae bacterium CFX9]
MSDSALEIRGLVKQFQAMRAVDEISLSVPDGAFLALLGPSGCGKTTTLRMLAGLENPTGGEIYFNGQLVASGERGMVVPPGQRDAGLVFQSYALWPHMTVYGNVEWPLKVKRWDAARRRARIGEVLDLLGIGHLAKRYPNQISGGEQQRVAIARTIAPEPKILLFDEPLSNLDAKLRVEMRSELMRVHRLTGATSVYVTHDQVEAMTMATHVAVMRSGRVEQFGSPRDLLECPASPFVARFVGTPPATLIHVQRRAEGYWFHDHRLGDAALSSGQNEWWFMYRADSMKLHEQGQPVWLPVEFAESTPVAGRAIVTVLYEKERFNVVVDSLPSARLGDRLYLELPDRPARVYPYDRT